MSTITTFFPILGRTPNEAIERILGNRSKLEASGFTLTEPRRGDGEGEYSYVEKSVILATVGIQRVGKRFGADGLTQCDPLRQG